MAPNILCTCKKCSKRAQQFRMVTADLHRRHLSDHGPSHLTPPDILEKYHLRPPKTRPIRIQSRCRRSGQGQEQNHEAGVGTGQNGAGLEDERGMDIDFGGPGEGFGDGRAYDDAAALDQARAGVPPPLGPPRNPPTVPDTHWTETGPPPEDYDSEDERKKAIPILPRAYTWKEPPGVRIAYYQAVINNVFKHQSVDQTESTLKTTLMAIDASGGLPVDPVPVQTLVSAKRRLGVDPDEHIIEYAICNLCWKHYRPSEVNHLPSPSCLTPDCPGVIYEESRNTENKLVREPKTISPQVSLIHSLRRIVHRKGFRKLVRDSRNSPRAQNDDPNFVMKDMHDGAMWHSLRTGIKREVGDFGAVRDAAVDEGAEKALTDHRFGLHLTVNTDWFGALKNRPHSCGPIFISIADLPREQRFLQVNVMCVAITPGPKEPTAEQFGHVMEPIVRDACRLKRGVKMDMYDDDDTTVVSEDVYADFICNNCDTPGARKIGGFAGHSADFHPCPWCQCTLPNVNQREGYVYPSFTFKNDFDLLRQKYRSKDASDSRKEHILSRYGVSFTALDWLPGWRPATQTPLDFMHCIFLGIVAYLYNHILFGAHMFGGLGGGTSPKQRFEDSLNSVQWPSHITRLPKNLGQNQSVKKADEWRRLLTVTPVILWLAWRSNDDAIPDTEPPLAPNEKISTMHSRKRKSLYDVILYLCAAVRLLSTKTISMAQAAIGQQYLVNYCQPMHYEDMIRCFGPVYAWWLFAYERFNGMLEKVKLNGHDGGRMELTMLRKWVMSHLIYELLLSLPDDVHPHERSLLDQIIKFEGRGSMLNDIAVFRSEASVHSVSLPKRFQKKLNLHRYHIYGVQLDFDLYELMYEHARTTWPTIQLRRELSHAEGISFVGNRVARRLPYVKKDGIRYGCIANNRTQADSFAFILRDSARKPIQILDLFLLEILVDGRFLRHPCALVRRLKSDNRIPDMPWNLFASVLGIYTSYAEQYHPPEIIPASDIDCPLALIPAKHFSTNVDLWISVSFDHVSIEPEEVFEDDE